jgi:hypothetical protein
MSDSEDSSDEGSVDESDEGSDDEGDDSSEEEFSDDDSADTRPLKKDSKQKGPKKNYAGLMNNLWKFEKDLDIPISCRILALQNIAIPLTYLAIGITQGLLIPILNHYAEDVGATSGQQGNLVALYTLPVALKVLFGYATDNWHFGGCRRRPALFMGWFISAGAIVALMTGASTRFKPGQEPPEDAPSMASLGATMFFYGFGTNLASVVADGMTAEKYQLEKKGSEGNFLISCLGFRYFGASIAVSTSTFVYASDGGGSYPIFVLLLLIPSLLLMFIMYLEEDVKVKDLKGGAKKNVANLWATIQTRAVWQPTAFIFLYNVVQVDNLAWFDFLELSLGFDSTQLNVVIISSLLFVYAGVIIFKYQFMDWSWKSIYCSTTVMTLLGSLMQILLINGITFGASDFFSAIFSQAWISFIEGVQLVPVNLIIIATCPKGGEATAFALYITVANFALFIAGSIGKLLLTAHSVTEQMLSDQEDAKGPMGKISWYAALLSFSGVFFLSLMPHSKEQVDDWKKKKWAGGGYIVLGMAACGFFYAITLAGVTIVADW